MNKRKILITLFVLVAAFAITFFILLERADHTIDEVRVGAILPMTGNAANYGELMRRGIRIALDEYNTTAMPSSPRFNVIIEDSKSGPKDGVASFHKLLAVNKVVAVMPALSSVVLACAPIAQENHVVLLNCPANSPKLRNAGDFIFNIAILSDQESAFLAEYAYSKLGTRRVGVFFVNNESGRGYADSFASKFNELGGAVVLSEGHEQGATEFRTIVEKFRSANLDLVFLTSYYSESALFLKQSKELDFQTKWLSYASIETPDFIELAGESAEGLIYSQPGFDANAIDPITKSFVEKYRNLYRQDPDFWVAQFYEGTRLLAAALASGARTGEEIRKYFVNLKDFEGISGIIEFDDQGGVTRDVVFKTVRSGKFEYIVE